MIDDTGTTDDSSDNNPFDISILSGLGNPGIFPGGSTTPPASPTQASTLPPPSTSSATKIAIALGVGAVLLGFMVLGTSGAPSRRGGGGGLASWT